jgi:hypothetical protein
LQQWVGSGCWWCSGMGLGGLQAGGGGQGERRLGELGAGLLHDLPRIPIPPGISLPLGFFGRES